MGKVLAHPLTVIAFCLVCIVIVVGLRKTSQKSELSAETIDALSQEVAKTAKEVEELKKDAEFAGTDYAKEQIARNELLLQKPGEYVVQVVTPEVEGKNELIVEEKLTPRQEWWKLLFE